MKLSDLDRVEITIKLILHNSDDPAYAFDPTREFDQAELSSELIEIIKDELNGDETNEVFVTEFLTVPKEGVGN